MVIVKVNCHFHPAALAELRERLRRQAQTGVLALPPYCELLAEVPDGTEVEVVAGERPESDCDTCAWKYCEHYKSTLRRVNCPLWRAKV